MSDTKFTKGEWVKVSQFTVKIGSADTWTYVSTQESGGIEAPVKEREANAHLIAAAPDHDEALCMIEEKITPTPSVSGGEYSITLNQEEVEKIRKSLSKARGEL